MAPGFDHTATFALPVPPAQAFRALIEPAQLTRWFAAEVVVDPRVGGAFTFSGRGAIGSGGVITALDDGRELGFQWTLDDVPTEVNLRVLAGDDDGTSTLEVEHRVRGALPTRAPRHFVDDLWRHYHGNLAEHLRGGANVVLPDLVGDRPEVRLSIEIDARPAKVFRALLEPALMAKWLGGVARVDLATGAYSYGWSYPYEGREVAGGPTRILELVENEKLVTDWPDWRGDPAKPATRVTWLLEPLAGGTRTRVTIIHDGFEHPIDRSDYQQGWGYFASGLRKVAEAVGDAA
ncbi:MAG: SRPBCC family protein [Kofleriaceae bacterium]